MERPAIPTLIKEGWLSKRGEYIKNWRNRYFFLYTDGSFVGFKEKPTPLSKKETLNEFNIRRSQILSTDKPKKYGFIIRCLQLTTLIERLFCCETATDRDDWVKKIKATADDFLVKEKIAHGADQPEAEAQENTSKKTPEIGIDSFEMLKVLGHGTFGKVLLARNKLDNLYYAIKILKKEMILEKDEVDHTIAEGRVLKNIRHPFLTSMAYFFQTKDRLFFVMQYVNGGELFFHISRSKVFSEERSRLYAAEITLSLHFLHQNRIVYRDLKLENILLDNQGHIKLADFGLCKESVGFGDKTKTFCGTPEYLAPEIIEDSEYGPAVDWWSLGIVSYECLCGRLPFYSKDHDILFELIITKEVTFTNSMSPSSKSFISELLNKNPNARLGGSSRDGEDVKNHPFFKSYNWDDVYNKKITPVFVPALNGPCDTRYFDEDFLSQEIKFTPPEKDVAFKFEL